MIRHQIARILSALADRIEPEQPTVEIQYVYVYSPPPSQVIPQGPYWQGPWVSSPNTCISSN